MSTILKALEKLEQEKREQPELSLDERIVAPANHSPTRRAWPTLVGAAAAGMGCAAAAIYFWPAPSREVGVEPPAVAAAPATEPLVAPPRTAPRANPDPAPPSEPAAPLPAPEAAPSRVEVVARLDADPAANAPAANTAPSALERVLARRERSQATEPPRDRSPRAPRTLPAARVDGPSPAAARPEPVGSRAAVAAPETRASTARSAERTEPAPVVAAAEVAPVARRKPEASAKLPAAGAASDPDHKVVRRAKIPELKVRSTVWHPQAGRRVATVEWVEGGEVLELHEGDAFGPLVVESIKPGGVFFSHDGVAVLHAVSR